MYNFYHMISTLKKAIEQIAALPDDTQEKIGEELLLHVQKVRRLRAQLDAGIRSLDRGDKRVLNIEDVIKSARAQYGKA